MSIQKVGLSIILVAIFCIMLISRNLPKISPPSKIHAPPFLNEVVAKDAFLSKVRPPVNAAVHAVVLSKKHRRSRKKQHEGRHAPFCYCVSKRMTKRGIAEPLHAQITTARLTVCKVGVFSREISQLSKIPLPSFRSHLHSSPMGVFLREISQLSKIRPPPGSIFERLRKKNVQVFVQYALC